MCVWVRGCGGVCGWVCCPYIVPLGFASLIVWLLQRNSITDADIDDILKKGEDDTRAMNEKMAEFTENARKFTMDGGMLNDYKVTSCVSLTFGSNPGTPS